MKTWWNWGPEKGWRETRGGLRWRIKEIHEARNGKERWSKEALLLYILCLYLSTSLHPLVVWIVFFRLGIIGISAKFLEEQFYICYSAYGWLLVFETQDPKVEQYTRLQQPFEILPIATMSSVMRKRKLLLRYLWIFFSFFFLGEEIELNPTRNQNLCYQHQV